MNLKGIKIEYCEGGGFFTLLSEGYEIDIPAAWKGPAANAPLESNSSITWGDGGGTLEVAKGFRWDISDPTSIFKKCKKLGKAAMVHDVLYNAITCKVVKRACVGEVNDLFHAHMREVGFPSLCRRVVISAVRLGVRALGHPSSDCCSGRSRFDKPCP